MMTGAIRSMASLPPLTSFHLQPGSRLDSVHLTGTIHAVIGKVTQKDTEGNILGPPRLKFLLKSSVLNDTRPRNDFIGPQETPSTAHHIMITLLPNIDGQGGEELVQSLESDKIRVSGWIGKEIILDLEGMSVVRVTKGKRAMEAELEGTGQRSIYKSGQIYNLLTPLAAPQKRNSEPPSWFDDSSSTGNSPRPHAEPPVHIEKPNPHLRPLTSHAVPNFQFMPESAQAGPSTHQPLGVKRSRSPEKMDMIEFKKARLEILGDAVSKSKDPAKNVQSEGQQTTMVLESVETNASPRSLPRRGTSALASAPAVLSPPLELEIDEHLVQSQLDTDETSAIVRQTRPERTNAPRPNRDIISRQKVEEDIKAKRRREAEIRAIREAEAQRAQQEAERRQGEESMKILTRVLDVQGIRYPPLNEVQAHDTHMMGIVADVQTPKQTAKKDWIVTLAIADPSSHTQGRASDDILVTVFRRTEKDLPARIPIGTPILFRKIRIARYNGKMKGNAYSNNTACWAVLINGQVKSNEPRMHPSIGQAEITRLKSLDQWWRASESGMVEPGVGFIDDRRSNTVSVGINVSPGRRGEMILAEVQHLKFFTATIKIMHIVVNTAAHKPVFELYVSDGTISSEPTRNFHNVDVSLPHSAVFCLAIKDQPPDDIAALLVRGNVIKVPNVRAKSYRGELELMWSEKVTVEQKMGGWKDKFISLVPKNDNRVRIINERINALKRGDVIPQEPDRIAHARIQRTEPEMIIHPAKASVHITEKELPPLATHITTTYTDEIDYPVSNLSDVISNRTVPNKFRVRARVKSVHCRGLQDNATYVQKHCTHCHRQFNKPYCQSCNDDDLEHAQLRYRFVAIIEQADVFLPIIISDEDAEAFLPALPPLSASTNPNDGKKLQIRIKEASEKVDQTLLGSRMNGERVRPVIDWSLETYSIKANAKSDEAYVVARAFGMMSKSRPF